MFNFTLKFEYIDLNLSIKDYPDEKSEKSIDNRAIGSKISSF